MELEGSGEGRPRGADSSATGLSVNGTTPALLAISASPSCQCIASAALQGMGGFISLATLVHISGLNLFRVSPLYLGSGGMMQDIPFVKPC